MDRRPIALAPLLLWTLAQLAAVALAAGRVPLSQDYSIPAERAAVPLVAITQLIAAALLFPRLLPTIRAAAAAGGVGLGFLALAAVLADRPAAGWMPVAAYEILWLAALHLLARRLKSDRGRLLAVAAVGLLVLGPPLLGYLRADLSPNPPFGRWWSALPLPATAALSGPNPLLLPPISGISALLFCNTIFTIFPKPPSH